MSEDSSNESRKGKLSLTRRRFVQSTALLTGVSVGGAQLIEASPLHAQESAPEKRLAQAAPSQGVGPPPAAPEKLPEPPTKPEISIQEFIKLSEVLTGIEDLEPDLADQYLERCAAHPDVKDQLKRLTQALSSLHGNRRAVEKGFADKLQADGTLFLAAEQIIYLWYIGAFYKILNAPGNPVAWDYGPPEHYFRGKVWGVMGVKPPMTAHGSNNYWSSKPTINGT